ncbi:MAG: hypothetical protein NC339_07380 [Muribaculaceae bacterium]|nr:hypothetical protein [Muribaculaceae bacterium]
MTESAAPLPVTTTEVFTTTSGQYFSTLLTLWLPLYGWSMLLPVAMFGALGVCLDDWRYLLIALMLVFIAVPMAISFLYTYYMLTPEVRMAIRPKHVEIRPAEGLTLIYQPQKTEGEDDTPDDGAPEIDFIARNQIKSVRFTSTGVIYLLDTSRLQFITVPYSSLPAGVSRATLEFQL